MIHLGVNIDHIATLRNARGGKEPNILFAAESAITGGADSITIHLREDRRHIRDSDVIHLQETVDIPLNLEMSIADGIVEFALERAPNQVTIVPEKREEQTTESGLDLIKHIKKIDTISEAFRSKGTKVCLFLDPDLTQLHACLKTSSRYVELHTGAYANATNSVEKEKEIKKLEEAALWCADNGVTLHAGHGLNYHNTSSILHLPKLKELNIGHSIISRSVFTGIREAVREMRIILNQASTHEYISKTKKLTDNN
jgi:pyridoxine 5-phosphate synthase